MHKAIGRRRVLAGVAAVVATPVAVAQSLGQTVHEVEISAFEFVPARLSVRVGDVIRWTNRDLAPHTATADDEGWDTDGLERGESAEIVVTKDMDSSYFCRFHPHMKGTLDISSDPA